MKVPFLDLQAHHQPIREQLDAAIRDVIDSGAFAGGPFVAAFERDFAKYCGSNFCIGVGNGTDALWLALLALGVGLGDEVITVPSTFMATAEAITYCGAQPAFVDIEEKTYTMDPALLERAITPRTKAIIPVQLFGQCVRRTGRFTRDAKPGLLAWRVASVIIPARTLGRWEKQAV
jgi:dTDP-4-amino-4,6-dideoxygalactose transaminase